METQMAWMWWEIATQNNTIRRQWRRSGVFIVNFEQISRLFNISIGEFKQENVSWASSSKKCSKTMCSNLSVLLKLAVTLTVTPCEWERRFSVLRRSKRFKFSIWWGVICCVYTYVRNINFCFTASYGSFFSSLSTPPKYFLPTRLISKKNVKRSSRLNVAGLLQLY